MNCTFLLGVGTFNCVNAYNGEIERKYNIVIAFYHYHDYSRVHPLLRGPSRARLEDYENIRLYIHKILLAIPNVGAGPIGGQ